MNKSHNDLRLLPAIFKKIGFTILFVSVLFAILSKYGGLEIDQIFTKTLVISGILISLLIIALSKNKIEDELTIKTRLKALAGSFIFGVVYVIVYPFINLLFGDDFMMDMEASQLLMSMLFLYFINVYMMKKNL